MRFRKLACAITIFFVVSSLLLAPYAFEQTSTRASAQSGTVGFQPIGSQWGTSTTASEPGPGDQDVPLTISLQYLYPYQAVSASFEIKLPAGFSSASGGAVQGSNNATAYYPSRLSQGQIFQIQTNLDLSQNLSLGTYVFPIEIQWYVILSNSSSMPEVALSQNTNITVTFNGDSKLNYATQDIELIPGEVNYVTLSLSNSGDGNASNISTTVSSGNSQAVSVLNQLPVVQSLPANSTTYQTIQMYVSASAAGSSITLTLTTSYLDAYDNTQSKSQTLGFFVGSLGAGANIAYRVSQESLTPGQVNNVSLVVTNEGTQTLTQISTQVSVTPSSVSVLSQPQTLPNLTAGSSATLELSVFVSASASNTPVTLSLSTNYFVAGSDASSTSSTSVGLYVASPSVGTSISVTSVSDHLTSGMPSTVSFLLTNTGKTPIYNPTFSLTVAQPLVVMSNSSYTQDGNQVAQNASMLYEATIVTSPSATVGAYGGSVSVTYTNAYGVSSTQTVQVGFILTGTIDFVIQDEQVTQGSGNLTVSGTLLNEGTAIAYYASASGFTNFTSKSVSSSSPSAYIGEVDPNTPVPFTATVPYSSRNSATGALVTLVITYKDSFGDRLAFAQNTTATLQPAFSISQPSTGSTVNPSGEGLVLITLYVMVALIVVAALAGAIFVRRRRRQNRGADSGVV